jgi:hypothetical protein
MRPVLVSNEPRLDLRFRPPRPSERIVELGGVSGTTAPSVPAAKASVLTRP